MSKLWFFGTGTFGALCLHNLCQDPQCRPELVVTPLPSVGGRGLKDRPSPVEKTALDLGLRLHRSPSVNGDEDLKAQLGQNPPDLVLVVDFGQKVLEPWLSGPALGCFNIHPSLLPQYRGAAPVQRAIMEGRSVTGVTIFKLVEAMDAGPIWLQEVFEIGPDQTAGELLNYLSLKGSNLLKKGLKSLLLGEIALQQQGAEGLSYAPKIEKAEALLDPQRGAVGLHDQIRALNPAPGAYFKFRGKRIKVWQSRLGDLQIPSGQLKVSNGKVWLGTSEGSLELITVQPEGKGSMKALYWEKGLRLTGGEEIDR